MANPPYFKQSGIKFASLFRESIGGNYLWSESWDDSTGRRNEAKHLKRPCKNPLKAQESPTPADVDYYSVEFAVDTPLPVYQFKLWRSERNGVFLLVKNSSELLHQLKIGHILPMKYMGNSAVGPVRIRETEITNIVNEREGRFRGHCRIELTIAADGPAAAVQ